MSQHIASNHGYSWLNEIISLHKHDIHETASYVAKYSYGKLVKYSKSNQTSFSQQFSHIATAKCMTLMIVIKGIASYS